MALLSDKSKESTLVAEHHDNQSSPQDSNVEEEISTSGDDNLERGLKVDEKVGQIIDENEVNSSTKPQYLPNK